MQLPIIGLFLSFPPSVPSTHTARPTAQTDLVRCGTIVYRVVVVLVVIAVIRVVHHVRFDHQQSTADYRNPFATQSRRFKGLVIVVLLRLPNF